MLYISYSRFLTSSPPHKEEGVVWVVCPHQCCLSHFHFRLYYSFSLINILIVNNGSNDSVKCNIFSGPLSSPGLFRLFQIIVLALWQLYCFGSVHRLYDVLWSQKLCQQHTVTSEMTRHIRWGQERGKNSRTARWYWAISSEMKCRDGLFFTF